MIRLLICDDSEPFRSALRATLAEQPEISVVGDAGEPGPPRQWRRMTIADITGCDPDSATVKPRLQTSAENLTRRFLGCAEADLLCRPF